METLAPVLVAVVLTGLAVACSYIKPPPSA